MPKHTISDVAKLAGVSVGTVSRIINNADNVDSDLRKKTMQAMRKLKYQPARRGRPERNCKRPPRKKRSSKLLALVFPETSEAYRGKEPWLSYMNGIERACSENSYSCRLYFAGSSFSDLSDGFNNCSGLLMKTPGKIPQYLQDVAGRIPVSLFGSHNPSLDLPQVTYDEYGAGWGAVQSLLKYGHHRIIFVNHRPCNRMFIKRSRGVLDALCEYGLNRADSIYEVKDLPLAPSIVPEKEPPEMGSFLEYALNLEQRPTALIFANDWAALGFYHACGNRGINLPETFSICGIDNIDEGHLVARPRLSSFSLPFEQVSYVATTNLISMIESTKPQPSSNFPLITIPGKFHLRESVIKRY